MGRQVNLLILMLLLLLSACSEETQEGTGINKINDGQIIEESVGGSVKENDSGNENLQAIEQIIIPTSLEEWKESKPGIFALDYSYDHETSSWPKDARELTRNELEELKQMSEMIADEDTLFKMLLYYFGSNVYGDLLDKQMNYSAVLNEPYLPEPTKETSSVIGDEEATPKAMLLLDASSSMLLPVDGKQKMGIAKTAMKRFANTIGASSEVSLYVYGHAGSQEEKDKDLSCTKIDEVYPMQPYSADQFDPVVDDVVANGWTPLAAAIKTANEASKNYEGALTIYIVSDGAETCDGDPIKEAEEFAKNSDNRKVNIIGFNVDQKGEDQLKAVAEAGNGEYISADNSDELNKSIEEKWVIPSVLDVAYIQLNAPNGFAISNAQYDISQISLALSFAISNERNRMSQMVSLMESEKIITAEQAEALQTKVQERKDTLSKWNDNLSESKKQTVEEEYNRIHQKIKAWTEEVNRLRSEQS
ncbi:VWA domain-containing protein [Psychrobacillus sp. FSL W7-1457]|uniref:vWA domain-containing protein n=1 Tax=unclassified Psychrobacillus TaxID=2636677 RepID=UPI0030F53A5F